jgi:hypothetical protein
MSGNDRLYQGNSGYDMSVHVISVYVWLVQVSIHVISVYVWLVQVSKGSVMLGQVSSV